MRLLKVNLICGQGPISPKLVKSVYIDLGHMERPNHTKFDIKTSILLKTVNTVNYLHRFTESSTSHIEQINLWGLGHTEVNNIYE